MEVGKIQVSVYTSRAKIPVAHATVLLRHRGKIIALQVTDASGKTALMSLSTPPESASTRPNKRLGYDLVDIWVEHPNFVTQKLMNVQVFPETESILPVELLPLGEDQSSLVELEVHELPTQNL